MTFVSIQKGWMNLSLWTEMVISKNGTWKVKLLCFFTSQTSVKTCNKTLPVPFWIKDINFLHRMRENETFRVEFSVLCRKLVYTLPTYSTRWSLKYVWATDQVPQIIADVVWPIYQAMTKISVSKGPTVLVQKAKLCTWYGLRVGQTTPAISCGALILPLV